jgi:hypothetical protein
VHKHRNLLAHAPERPHEEISSDYNIWRGGPQKGQPKLPPPANSLVDRGLMRLDTSPTIPRLFFTEAGMTALGQMMADRRFADPGKFAHVRRELGVGRDPPLRAAE